MYEKRSLPKSIEIRIAKRPIKIAYLVPSDESPENHFILDAVFQDCHARWAGGLSPVIPTGPDAFIDPDFRTWLQVYDPDYVYSFVQIGNELVQEIDSICCPISILRHEKRVGAAGGPSLREYLPDWSRHFRPISCISTITSPAVGYHQYGYGRQEGHPFLITMFEEVSSNRFVGDNFGSSYAANLVTNPVPGLFHTIALVPINLDKRTLAGTRTTTSDSEILSEVAQRRAYTLAGLSFAHSESIPVPEVRNRTTPFALWIGESCRDRISFWNSRILGMRFLEIPSALIMPVGYLENSEFMTALGNYLNNFNWAHSSGGQPEVLVRSHTVAKDGLNSLASAIQKNTFNRIFVDIPSGTLGIIAREEAVGNPRDIAQDSLVSRMQESPTRLEIGDPDHFAYIPPRFRAICNGQCIAELSIERHNGTPRFINVFDEWQLPRRLHSVRSFVTGPARIAFNHRIAALSSSDDQPLFMSAVRQRHFVELNVPNDDDFLASLLLSKPYLDPDDLRSHTFQSAFLGISPSDKGRNLRGVISLFNGVSSAAECLTNSYWREALKRTKPSSHRAGIFSLDTLASLIPNSKEKRDALMEAAVLKKPSQVRPYYNASLMDAMEHLIRCKVFFQVHVWTCSFCGHTNTRTIDELKTLNDCDICKTKAMTPVDFHPLFKFNEFVYRSLCEHNGLTVLWAISYLLEHSWKTGFLYLPEADLRLHSSVVEKTEIDLLAVVDGEFIAGEVKLSVLQIANDAAAIGKLADKLLLLRPDTALIVFQQYAASEDEKPEAKRKLTELRDTLAARLGRRIKVRVVVAEDVASFRDFPRALGVWGRQTFAILDSFDKEEKT